MLGNRSLILIFLTKNLLREFSDSFSVPLIGNVRLDSKNGDQNKSMENAFATLFARAKFSLSRSRTIQICAFCLTAKSYIMEKIAEIGR